MLTTLRLRRSVQSGLWEGECVGEVLGAIVRMYIGE